MVTQTPLDLSRFWNATRANDSPTPGGAPPWHPEIVKALGTLPSGAQTFWGLPFRLGPAGEGEKGWLLLDGEPVSIPIGAHADYIVVAHFCNASVDPTGEQDQPAHIGPGAVLRPGEHLADYTLVYEDGSEHCQPIRRRYEVNEACAGWGQRAFAARGHFEEQPLDLNGPYPRGVWGWFQTGVREAAGEASLWLYALENPSPELQVVALCLEPTGVDRLAVAGITLYQGTGHPLRRRRLETFRVTLPEAARLADVSAEVDLGLIVRRYAVPAFASEAWLAASVQGLGEKPVEVEPTRQVLLDITASDDATLVVAGHEVRLGEVHSCGEARSRDGTLRVEVLTPHKTWVHVTIEDATTHKPTPVRVHLRAADGRYLPPYGHRHEVNTNWFEDYGADLQLGQTPYAYVDGQFQVELPVGEVYLEVWKGFEYQPLRQRVVIAPGQRELKVAITRPINLREKGWVTADTHVHFISPQTAWLEAQGEGVNLVNLLASQWGDLFTNVGDLSGAKSGVSQGDTIVWVGTENRQHLLGHISLLGTHGAPIDPMCASGPGESYFGDPSWSSMAEWAERNREQEGVVVIPHFPTPYCEVAADLVLGKVDGVEIRSFSPSLDNYQMREWYRYLNCGYRVAAVGGTDKMWAGMPVGGVRTYADLKQDEFSFESWGRAVRAGRTFTSSGPLIGLLVEGREVGDELKLPVKGGTLDVQAWAESVLPFHRLEIVVNGKVVTSEVDEAGTGKLTLRDKVTVGKSSWIAARCVSRHQAWHVWPVHIAAHTSPVYITVGEERQFSAADATYMLTLLDGGLTWLDTLSIPADPERQARIRQVFLDAKEALHQRLHAAGQGHTH